MMRRSVVRLSWLLLIPLLAADAHAQYGGIGVKGGENWTDLSGDAPTTGGNGFIGGVYAFGQSGYVVAQFEVLFSKRSFTDGTASAEVRESFVQVPALFGVRGSAGTVNAMLYSGPSLSFKSSCKVDVAAAADQDCRTANLAEKGTLWSLILGLTIDVQLDRVVLLIDGRYDNGLTDAFENREGKWRSWVLMAGIGILMPT